MAKDTQTRPKKRVKCVKLEGIAYTQNKNGSGLDNLQIYVNVPFTI